MLKFPNNQNPTSNQLEGAPNIAPLLLKYQHRHQSQTNGADDATRKAKPQIQCERKPFLEAHAITSKIGSGSSKKTQKHPPPVRSSWKEHPFRETHKKLQPQKLPTVPLYSRTHTHTLFNDTSKENTRKKQFFFCYRLKKSNPFDMGR